MEQMKRILIADDSDLERNYYKYFFRRLNVECVVELFSDGSDIITALRDNRRDLLNTVIITDYAMPTSGLEVVAQAVSLGIRHILIRSSCQWDTIDQEVVDTVGVTVEFLNKSAGQAPLKEFLARSGLNLR